MARKDTKHVGGVLDGLLRRWEEARVKKGNKVLTAFAAATEAQVHQHARPVSFKKGVLLVIVANPTWLYKLTLDKQDILRKFNDSYEGRKKATDIRFRIGQIEE